MKMCKVNVFRKVPSHQFVEKQKVDSLELPIKNVVEKLESYSKGSAGSVVKLDKNLEFEIVSPSGFPIVFLEPGINKFFAMQA